MTTRIPPYLRTRAIGPAYPELTDHLLVATPARGPEEKLLDRYAARCLMHFANLQRLRPERPATEILREAQKRAKMESRNWGGTP